MGSGAFGSNGSVHWEIRYTDGKNSKPDHRDYDDTKRHPDDPNKAATLPLIGQGKAKGSFRITARYPNKAAAVQALEAALKKAESSKGSSVVVLDVGLRNFRQRSGNSDGWEVKIDW